MKFSRFVALITILSLSLGAYVLEAQTKKHARRKAAAPTAASAPKAHEVITGKAAFIEYSQQKPGVFRRSTIADLPEPFARDSVDNDRPTVPRSSGPWRE